MQSASKQAYITGDFNIDLLQLHTNAQYNTFYDNTTAQGFFPKITRPTRSVGNSHTLIDNVFTNNLCKQHTSGILTHRGAKQGVGVGGVSTPPEFWMGGLNICQPPLILRKKIFSGGWLPLN